MKDKVQFPTFPETASTFASKVDVFYLFLWALTIFFTVLVVAGMMYLAVKYRRRSKVDIPKAIHGNNALEITWTVIPLIIGLFIFFWAAHLYFIYAKPPKDALEILVTGKQWMWKIQHPTGKREINELHIPIDEPVKLTMTSEDVIHSFFVPAFRTKTDVVPGRYTATWFEATKEGKYHLFCAEYCGTEHSVMGGSVYVMSNKAYEDWSTDSQGDLTPVEAGMKLFEQYGCATCHNAGSGAQGPNLAGVFGSMQPVEGGGEVFADEDYIYESIVDPRKVMVKGYQPIMPVFKGLLKDTQLMQLVAYIKSLGGEQKASLDAGSSSGKEVK